MDGRVEDMKGRGLGGVEAMGADEDLRVVERGQLGLDFFERPIPPGNGEKIGDEGDGDTVADDAGRHAGDHGVGRDIAGDDAASGDGASVSEAARAQDANAFADPDIVTDFDLSIALRGGIGEGHGFVNEAPVWPIEEGVGGNPFERVVHARHGYGFGEGAEAAHGFESEQGAT